MYHHWNHNVNPTKFTTPPQHEVYRHAKAGDISKVKYWLEEQNYPIDKTDFYSNTVLYYGCLCNHPTLVSYLMERGATFKRRTPDGKRTFLASSNQVIRHILLGKNINGEPKIEPYVEMWHAEALRDTTFSDVTFVVNEKSFSAHKSIVAARCPNLIPKMEKQNKIVFGAAMTEMMFSTLLTYIYSDKVDQAVVEQLDKSFGKIASKLDLKGLQALYEDPKAAIDPIHTMPHTMKRFINNPQFSDIVLTTPDGGSIFCHKIILVTRCDYFKTFFSMKWADNDSIELQLNEISKDVLEVIVEYIYSGTYEVNATNIWEVLAAAGQFLLPRLQQELELEIVKNYLDVDSCIELASAADVLSCAKVYKASVRVIANNFSTLSNTPQFLDLPPAIQAEVSTLLHPKKKT